MSVRKTGLTGTPHSGTFSFILIIINLTNKYKDTTSQWSSESQRTQVREREVTKKFKHLDLLRTIVQIQQSPLVLVIQMTGCRTLSKTFTVSSSQLTRAKVFSNCVLQKFKCLRDTGDRDDTEWVMELRCGWL